MKIVQINTVYASGSTGKICRAVSEILTEKGVENYILFSAGKSEEANVISCCNKWYTKAQALKSRVFANYGFNSQLETRRMISHLERIKPDIVHLHNIHGHDCHLGMLFDCLREKQIKVYWTFHDCWAFTAYCPYFDLVECEKWKNECFSCNQRNRFSFFFDRSKMLYRKKQEAFSDLDLTIITPSQWLADLVKESFLKDYPVKVIHNGIDLSIFKPTPSDFREKYGILAEKKILLGVAFGWGVRKGLDVFLELEKRLDKEKYQIVLVGTDEKVDRQLPPGIISIHRTQNQQELAEIYTAADLFVNPTREENYPTVNMESIACGTPVLTFRTGGSPEILDDATGAVVDCDDVDALEREIIRICRDEPYSGEACIARAKCFDMNERFEEYIRLYEQQ